MEWAEDTFKFKSSANSRNKLSGNLDAIIDSSEGCGHLLTAWDLFNLTSMLG